jgi:hypothetical protein
MKPFSIMRLTMFALTFLVGGCSTFWHHKTSGTALPQASATPASGAGHATATPRKSKTRVRGNAPDRSGLASRTPPPAGVPESPASPPTATAPAGRAAAVTPNVTLEDNDADRDRARALVDGANARLAQIDRSKLSGETSAAFHQASDLAGAARKAMDQHDYLAASGLARKATMLTDQVAARTSSQ